MSHQDLAPAVVSAGDEIHRDDRTYVVQPRCDDQTARGYWYCVKHGGQAHNLAAAGHTMPGCKLAWFCLGHNEHEVP